MTRRIDNKDTQADIELRSILDAQNRSCFVMIAGAGSGKTTSLIKALSYIETKYGTALRQRGQQVACITYTEGAVNEILTDVGNYPLFHVSTIHSFLWNLAKSLQGDLRSALLSRLNDKIADLNSTKAKFTKRHHLTTIEKNAKDIAKAEEEYQIVRDSKKRITYGSGSNYSEGVLGHDDIIKLIPRMIQEQPVFRSIIAHKYPFFFIDESQDTFPAFVDSLRLVAHDWPGKFCLGFFGDPMQKIYGTGVGPIALIDGWKKITKPENFRSPSTVLSVINKIRVQKDAEFVQVPGERRASIAGQGLAEAFIFQSDEHRARNIDRVMSWMADKSSDPKWKNSTEIDTPVSADVRILVTVHRMAARRLNYLALYSAFNDSANEWMKDGFTEGTSWLLRPFLDFVVPLTLAFRGNQNFEVISLLRSHCPRLGREELKSTVDHATLLASLKDDIAELARLISLDGSTSILDVLKFIDRSRLFSLDERFKGLLETWPPQLSVADARQLGGSDEIQKEELENICASIHNFLATPAKQLFGYVEYFEEESPYSTQQGIKGAEFERVLVVVDEEEGKHFQFSYNKLFGLEEPSETDLKHEANGEETIIDRTRRLFYVCCSRATKDLAVVLFTSNAAAGLEKLKERDWFEDGHIHTLSDLG